MPYTIRYTYNNIRHNLADPHDTITHTYVLKEMASAPDLDVIRESAIYSARGELLQKKKITEVNGFTEIVTDGVHVQDALGRVVVTLYPSISTSHMWKYDNSSNSIGAYKTIYRYDALDRNVKTILPDLSEINIRYHFATDSTGALRLMTRQTDQLGNVTFTLSSPQGWTTQKTLADGSSTLFDYNCIGELTHVTDADGYETYYEYDLFERRTRRILPDAGVTEWHYDPAGNVVFSVTQRQNDAGEKTRYNYCFNRLMSVIPSAHPWDSVHYNYDAAGRLAMREDVTGSERVWYDAFGNICMSHRRVIIPSEHNAWRFILNKKYDSFGRIRNIVYPDGERVNYDYNIGGDLLHVASNSRIYLDNIQYDELGHVIKKAYGNNTRSFYDYDQHRQWLKNLYTDSYVGSNHVYQNIYYEYDYVGNITRIRQAANAVSGMGGQYEDNYIYDHRYRLVQNLHTDTCIGSSDYLFEYSPTTRMGEKRHLTLSAPHYVLSYGYDIHKLTHQIRTIYDEVSRETMQLYWDRNGNLCQTQIHNVSPRFHIWNDDNKMLLAVGPKDGGLYGYSAAGDRPYKLTGTCGISSINAGFLTYEIQFDNAVIYPNPYLTITPYGYFKHYFAGTERIATAEGNVRLENWLMHPKAEYDAMEHDIVSLLRNPSTYLSYDNYCTNPQSTEQTPNEDISGQNNIELQYQEGRVILGNLNFEFAYNLLNDNLPDHIPSEGEVYFYHMDHLGSASWITDHGSNPVQYLQYAPYGEITLDQHPFGYDERFKFTGKELDAETGYFYFGARSLESYYINNFTSVDPLTDKYIGTQSYLYCNGNPVGYIDPNGNAPRDVVAGYVIGFLTSVIPGTSFLRDNYSPISSSDYNAALANVDNASFIAGSGMAAAGASGIGAGTSIVIAGGATASTGVGAPEGAVIAAGGGVVIAGSEALTVGGAILMANATSNKAQGYNRGGSSQVKSSSTLKDINQLQQDVKKGKAPKGITNFHRGKIKGEQEHVHFKDGSALNKDGTWKHGKGNLTNEQRQYLKQNGWNIE